jgi:predicted dehydrogenase
MAASARYRCLLAGYGKVAGRNSDDPLMVAGFRYPNHASVLEAHPRLDLVGIVDPSAEARAAAAGRFPGAQVAGSFDGVSGAAVDIAVLAGPPEGRPAMLAEILAKWQVKAVLLEKPVAIDEAQAQAVDGELRRRGIVGQVNLWRRCDRVIQQLASGQLRQRVGPIQGGMLFYGGGLANNGFHLVDLCRLLLGEIKAVQAVPETAASAGPIAGDVNVDFVLHFHSGAVVHGKALDFSFYRENGVDLWGQLGRLSILNDSRRYRFQPLRPHGTLTGQREVAVDEGEWLPTGYSDALYDIYDDVVDALDRSSETSAPVAEAVRSGAAIAAVFSSLDQGGRAVGVGYRS